MADDEVHMRIPFPEDAQGIIDFLKAAAKESDTILIPDLDKLTEEEERIVIDATTASPNDLMLIAHLGDEIVGLLTIRHVKDQSAGELGVVVKKEYWGNGIGTLLVDEGIYWFTVSSYLDHLILDVYEGNERAIHLYKKLGFVVVDHQETKNAKGETVPTLIMEYQSQTDE